jgi:hypothetical protein
MSIAVSYAATVTVVETLPNNTGSAAAANRVVTHAEYNEVASLGAASTPPATLVSEFLLTLSVGAATIDLRTLTGTNGAVVDGNGLKVQIVRIKNLGANNMTFKGGAANPHNMFTVTTGQVVFPGAHIMIYSNDNGDDIDATHKEWDVSGTASQTAEVTIIMG